MGHAIFTQAETRGDLRAKVREAAALHCEGEAGTPRVLQLHYVRDGLLPLEAA